MEQHELGALIKQWRWEKGRSVRDLAQAVNIHHTTLCRYVSGERRLNEDLARRLDDELETGGALSAALSELSSTHKPLLEQVPKQLPTVSRHFVGRRLEWEQLGTFFAADATIVVIDGPPGVGKTSLAVRWATEAEQTGRFPDGVLFADLQGFTPESRPADPASVLEDFLRALGAVDHIADGERARAAQFRTVLARRVVLIVLDNAESAQQVRPLLPGNLQCHVVITSRRSLPGIVVHEGAGRVSLEPLEPKQATQLLSTIIGARAHEEPEAVHELTRLCGALPLALRVVGERVAAHPHHSLTDLARELDAARLDSLSAGDDQDETAAVRAVFEWSYRALDPAVARIYRLIGLHTGPHLSLAAIAALADEPLGDVRMRMRVLCTAHLVVEYARDRYRLHDLLRLYAAERATLEESADRRRAAVRRLVDYYFGTVDRATRILASYRMHPEIDHATLTTAPDEIDSYQQALTWCDNETSNFPPLMRLAVEYEYPRLWRLAASLWDYFNVRQPWSTWTSCNQLALQQALQEGDRYGEAWILTSIGDCLRRQQDHEQARRHFRDALLLREQIDDRPGQGWLWFCLGLLAADEGVYSEAVTSLTQALTIFIDLADTYAQGRCLLYRGQASYERHEIVEARDDLDAAIDRFAAVDDVHDQAVAWTILARIYDDQGEYTRACEYLEAALPPLRAIGDWQAEVDTLVAYGRQLWRHGETQRAREYWSQAFTVLDHQGAVHEARSLRDSINARLRAEGADGDTY